jgi:hypothetical protein
MTGCSATQHMGKSTQSLLDKDLSQFSNIYDYGNAEYINGELVLTSTKNWFFTTKKSYKNFILSADVLLPNVTEYSNSGILFRGQTGIVKSRLVAQGYQAEVDPSNRRWSGGLFDQARRMWLHPFHPKRSFPDEKLEKKLTPTWDEQHANAYKHLEWNRYRIECIDSDIKIYVNGVLTTHVVDTTDKEGVIGFQHHGSKELIETGTTNNLVKFKNIYITELN